MPAQLLCTKIGSVNERTEVEVEVECRVLPQPQLHTEYSISTSHKHRHLNEGSSLSFLPHAIITSTRHSQHSTHSQSPSRPGAAMVFYEPPKRRPCRRATDGKITDLPDELLLLVLHHLKPLDVLRFRLTCRTFTPASTSDITKRMKKLYISPSRSSLLAAIAICGHPEFSSNIVSYYTSL